MQSKGIRGWAFLTTALYGLALCLMFVPLAVAAFYSEFTQGDLKDIPEAYASPIFWGIVGALTLLEGLLLLVPMDLVRERPIRRRRWITLAVVAAFMMGLLMAGVVSALVCAAWSDPDYFPLWTILPATVGWIFWGIVFSSYASRTGPSSALKRVMDQLIMGSVAELLIAVPSHIVVRQRKDCCAPGITFLGIATGLVVLLFAYGPSAYFLFQKRVRRLKANPEGAWASPDDRSNGA